MEEEIITPEEETFDLSKLRYILDNEGYIFHASFGGLIICDLGECTEYTGDIPEGYSTIEEWYEGENEKLNAWKVVDDNLVFDNVRYEVLQAECEKQEEDNRPVVHKEIKNITNIVNEDIYEKYMQSTSNLAKISSANDSNKFASRFIHLKANKKITGSIQIKFNNSNFLTNDATSKNEGGISFEVNSDRTINLNGTAENDIEFNIAGTNQNTKSLLTFKKNTDYYLLSNGYTIKMYCYDGTDRTEVYNGKGGIINFTDNDKQVTQIVLYIPNGTVLEDITIYPMLNLGTAAEPYVMYEGNTATINLAGYTFNKEDNIKITDGKPVLQNEIYINDDLYIGNDFIIGGSFHELVSIDMPKTYKNTTYFYTDKDTSISVTYPNLTQNLEYENTQSKNGGFSVDEEGNVTLKDALLNGGIVKIFNKEGQLLLQLDTTGQHFYDTDGNEIGDIGLIEEEGIKQIAFAINGTDETNQMAWGIKKGGFIPVFYYKINNTENETSTGGLFIFEAPPVLQENYLYLGQDEEGPYIQGLDNGERKTTTLGNVDDIYIYDSYGNELLVLNSDYLKYFENLEMYTNLYGYFTFDFKENYISNVSNVPLSEAVSWFNGSSSNLYVQFRDGSDLILYPSTSDARLKKDIKDSGIKALDIIKKIIHRQFKWKDTDKQVDIGYIAQELEEIDPNLIHKAEVKDENDNVVDYDYQINNLQILSLCTKSIQEQQEVIEQQQAIIDKQQKQIEMLMKAVGLEYGEEQTEQEIKPKIHKVKDYGEKPKIKIDFNKKYSMKERKEKDNGEN